MTLHSTDLYVRENERLKSLKTIVLHSGNKIYYETDSLSFLIKSKIKLLKLYRSYLNEKKRYQSWISQLKTYQHTKKHKSAIVIGNGPSQGYLTVDVLNQFKKNGGEIFVVNFWNQNPLLSNVIPNYIVISDPQTLSNQSSDFNDKNISLKNFILNNPEIKIICPTYRCEDLGITFGSARIIGFIDTELRGLTNNINPTKARGYVSMTLYKALAMALWFGYEKIFILGMDNTYPRNTYCDSDNKILNLEIHAGINDFITDHSERYMSMGDLMVDLSHLYYDAKKFAHSNKIFNLDPYSLTDAFPKARTTSLIDLL